MLLPLLTTGAVAAVGGAGTYNTPFLTFGSTKASMRTVPTASKKFGRSGLARDDPRALPLPLFEDALGRRDEPDPG